MTVNWENSDFVRRLCYALNIAKQTIKLLAAEGFNFPEDANNNIRPEKIIGETAYLMLAASSAGETYIEVKNKIEELVNILIPYARSKKTLFNICLYPALALEYAQAHICITELGYPDAKFDTLLAKTINAHAHYGHERPPHRMMEQEWMREIWNNGSYKINNAILYSSLANPIDLLHGTSDDMYAFTHALMYASKHDGAALKLPRNRKEILNEAEAMLAKCLDKQDYDLTGELILAWPLTREPWSAASVFAFHVLAKVEDEVGFLPSLGIQIKTLEKLDGENRKKYLYSSAYHTIYVMGLVCSSILKYHKTPPKQIPINNSLQGSAPIIMPYLKKENNDPYWINLYYNLNENEQNSLTPFLFNVALIRNIQQQEYKNVYQLLKVGYELGITNTSIAAQAAELLERINMLSGVLSS